MNNKIMRILFLVTVVLISVMNICGQTNGNSVGHLEKPTLIFSGKVTEIEDQIEYWKETPQADRILIKLDISLKNTGSVPIIFLDISSSSSASIWQMTETRDIDDIHYEQSIATSSSAMKKSEWEKFKNSLDKPTPPKNLLRVLQPRETYEFEGETRLRLERHPEDIHYTLSKNVSLEYLQKLSPVWLKISMGSRDETPILVNKYKINSTEKLEFLIKLQKRWSSYGYLWLDNIESELISLDLNSLTGITKFQP